MAQLKVDVIVAANDAAGRAAQRATRAIPIVIAIMGDPIGAGFVATFARPGGNITGLTSQGRDVTAKRLQLFNEAFPHLTRMALLADTTDLIYRPALREAEIAGQVLGVQLRPRYREFVEAGALCPMSSTVAMCIGALRKAVSM